MPTPSDSICSQNEPPTHSLWGPVETCQTIAPGIYRVTTRSHGGYILSDEQLAQMPPALRHPDENSFEEDCRWCLVVLAFPTLFTEKEHTVAGATCRNWFPDIWEAWTGVTLSPEESFKKKETLFYTQHQHDWIVVIARGDWHPAVPKGFVAVQADYGGRPTTRKTTHPQSRYFLIPEEEYCTTRPFVIDLARHQEIPSFQ